MKPPLFRLCLASVSLATIAQLNAAVGFLGVASGDASSSDAVVWTRAVDSAAPASVPLTLQVATDPGFANIVFSANGSTDPNKDYILKLGVTGLQPATVYYYRFAGPTSLTSNTGKFKTAPLPTMNYPLHFAFSGDCDGLIRPYALASQVPGKNLDFFMFDGDTEYETSASIGSPAVHSTGNIPDPNSTTPTATGSQLFADFSRKYREQFGAVNSGGQNGLQSFFAGQANYTAYDNHELGNKQYINGGAPAGGAVGSTTGLPPFDFTTGAGVDARLAVNDTNISAGDYMNRSGGFQILQQVFMNYQPIKERGLIMAPADPRTNGTRQLYFAQPWGRNSIFVNLDDRTYRDIRIKTAANADDNGARADNPSRTILGATQLAWVEQTLLDAQNNNINWKFINISDPIDEIGPIGGTLTLNNAPTTADYGTLGSVTSVTTTTVSTASKTVTVANTRGLVPGQGVSGSGVPANTTISAINTDGTTFTINNTSTIPNGTTLSLTPAASTYSPVSNDGGKSWMGGYRAERNALLKFIADHQVTNVVFLATDDHQNRINELTYSPTSDTANQASYVKVPYCFSIVAGPLGATGPDLISNHTFGLAKKLADSIANAEAASGIEPIGLAGYPGLHNVTRLGDPSADTLRQPADFYSPDTFNYNVLDVSADGKTLTVTSYGINSTVTNSFLEYDAVNNPERVLFSFQIDAPNRPPVALAKNITVSAGSNCQATVAGQQLDNGSYDPDAADTLSFSLAPAGPFAIGVHSVTLTVMDNHGATSTAPATITVVDTTPPVISGLTASPSTIWPPDNKLIDVTLSYSITDCSTVTPAVRVTSNEATAAGDITVLDPHHLRLRASRIGSGNGRIYTIVVTATDSSHNSSTASTAVTVLHDQGK